MSGPPKPTPRRGAHMAPGPKTPHTPGPWTVAEERFGYDVVIRTRDRHDPIATGILAGYTRPEGIANARLIAAAPELLAACKALAKPDSDEAVDINRDYTDTDAAIDQIRAAIAKAEGR